MENQIPSGITVEAFPHIRQPRKVGSVKEIFSLPKRTWICIILLLEQHVYGHRTAQMSLGRSSVSLGGDTSTLP